MTLFRCFLVSFFLLVTAQGFCAEKYQLANQLTLFNGDTLYEYHLDNGLRVLMVPRHQAKVLTFQTWFDVGSIDEKLDSKLKKTGLAHLFEHMMFRGTKKIPDGKFDQIISRIGGVSQNASTWYHRTNYYESIPSHQLETLMAIESDRMKNLRITAKVFKREKGVVVNELHRGLDSPSRVASNELMRTVFRKAPYRYTVIGTEKEIRGFSLKEADYFYRTFYAPNNGTIVLVGSFKPKSVMDLVNKFYGSMKSQPIPKAVVPKEPPQKKERRATKTHAQATSEILLIAYRGPSINSSDVVPLSLLTNHLAAGKEGRLKKLLVDTGIAVGASAYPRSKPALFQFSVHMAEKQRAETALRIIDKEIASLKKTVISANDFERALNLELLWAYNSIGSNTTLASFLGENLMIAGNYMRGFEILEAFKSMTPKALREAAKKYLVRSSRSIVIVRPPKKKGKKKS